MANAATIVTLSDTHCGSTLGLLKPGFTTLEGNEIGLNPLQAWLWECWTAAMERLPRKFDVLVINGDVIDGNHHGTKEIISPEERDHASLACEVLKPLAKRAKRVFVTLGTEVHTCNQEHSIAKALGAQKIEPRGYAHANLLLEINGHLASWQHHCSVTSRPWLESGEYSRAIVNEQYEAVRAGLRPPTIMYRAHRHRPGVYQDLYASMVVTGGWQGCTRHTRKAVPGAIPAPCLCVTHIEAGMPPVHKLIGFTPPERDRGVITL